MRIGMHQRAVRQQRFLGAQRVEHRLGRLEHVHAGEARHRIGVDPVLGHRVRHLEPVAAAELEVVGTVAGRDVHEARAFLVADEIGGQERHVETVAVAEAA